MSFNKSPFFLFLIVILSISCRQKPAKVEAKVPEKIITIPYDTLNDDLAAFISGLPYGKTGCLDRLDTTTTWRMFSSRIDSGFSELDTTRFDKMRQWSDSELLDRKGKITIFYPFGGPDLLYANIFYPNAEKYILIGLEPIGTLPDLCNISSEQVNKYLEDIRYSLRDVFKRSYFITENMIGSLRKNSVNGVVPLISLFVKQTGHHIKAIQSVGIDNAGNEHIDDSLRSVKGITRGIRIDFVADTGRNVQSVYYFQTDLSDEGLKKNQGFQKYLSQLPESFTYLKAASYLMHNNEFSMIRSIIFEKSKSILQDDSGISYKFFDKSKWDVHLYGKYARPGKEFSWINETDLAKAYNDPKIKPVPFTLGYNWRTRQINLLYAIRK